MRHKNTGDTGLKEQIFQKIDKTPAKAISFADFMELALYEPDLGYYSQPGRVIGRQSGDFYTSVSVGKCFGLLLGYAIEAEWEKNGSPGTWLIVEQGAHDGQLAFDILDGLKNRGSSLLDHLSYHVIEAHQARRDFLIARIEDSDHSERVKVANTAGEVQNPQQKSTAGIFLCNELVDAFPVHRITLKNSQWQEIWVKQGGTPSGFEISYQEITNPDLLAEASRLNKEEFPENYTTEINLAMHPWLDSIRNLFADQGGHFWIIDYGHLEEQYYSPERREGTLRCYHQHRASDDPFVMPGECDITAHVNFTRLADYAQQAGLQCQTLQDQHDFLTHAAKSWLLGMEAEQKTQEPDNKKLLRQFQTLTHPGMMGRAFKVLKLQSSGADRI
ncbi:MAG: SAM-dependent methyltransferase [Verrucomicrobiota bacterium]